MELLIKVALLDVGQDVDTPAQKRLAGLVGEDGGRKNLVDIVIVVQG
jgi:hypothetical protein